MALLSTDSWSDEVSPSQCSDIPCRAFMFQMGTMSELPIVVSTGCFRMPNLAGLKGSMRPGPQSGLRFIHAYLRCCRCNPFLVAGISTSRYCILWIQDSRVRPAMADRISSVSKRGSSTTACRNRK